MRRLKLLFLPCEIVLMTAATERVVADEVHLVHGDVLVGTIVEEDASTVTLEHPVFGVMTVPRDVIAVVVTEEEPSAASTDAPTATPPAEAALPAVATSDATPAEATAVAGPEESAEECGLSFVSSLPSAPAVVGLC